ncbi:hypothetical protein PR048_001902 [Dryococelus australis]|uniref:DNA/RNA non-specific endonuclease/pyrophosphatase/phosphodiesterase domain-containing protein n=1 Tax=Dryococelus australis TaxID=614101 RepID=A0ABQ9IL67_9NEOP|nr:hypothetical protein PR048_001902 [Dryococelus australis]
MRSPDSWRQAQAPAYSLPVRRAPHASHRHLLRYKQPDTALLQLRARQGNRQPPKCRVRRERVLVGGTRTVHVRRGRCICRPGGHAEEDPGLREPRREYVSGALPPEVQESSVERYGLREKCWDGGAGRSECYLSEGHLADREDFVYVAQQFATFYHANSAPQWHSIKTRNWRRVSEAMRRYASSRQADLEVYVGTYGLAKVEVPGNGIAPLHLHYEGDDDARTPVPEQMWKLVVDRARNRGAVFLVHNNPYLTTEQAESGRLNCSSGVSNAALLGEVGWADVGEGYTYCCTVSDFLPLLPLLPQLATADMQPLSLLATEPAMLSPL